MAGAWDVRASAGVAGAWDVGASAGVGAGAWNVRASSGAGVAGAGDVGASSGAGMAGAWDVGTSAGVSGTVDVAGSSVLSLVTACGSQLVSETAEKTTICQDCESRSCGQARQLDGVWRDTR